MHLSEELAKKYLNQKGYNFLRRGGKKGMPDFVCQNGSKKIYIEIKSKGCSLTFNQLKEISKLIENGNDVLLLNYDGNEFETFKINLYLKPFKIPFKKDWNLQTDKLTITSNINKNLPSYTKTCKCGKELTALKQSQLEYMMFQHKLSKSHRKFVEREVLPIRSDIDE